ncbi:uncharacterized protein LOC100159280 isoform X2 [Acyrthosiphon pisum]|uniref:Resistance to inhibitors of cholinesterase protein 3 N-terminal domain-containing protein n=1 Tax=Acyrthosiphon pisum TaxID=7029 RepID=A0A8R2B791_ACYPI|nr:uncharacterized protein LOC100159280 isoform X2 [Acyrthosiphon pisum]|eukprot:XP_008184680.1 PREDICTED: uncharacterized protein LOC100159280 isoform X2 [Acyrthosiphon pisum]
MATEISQSKTICILAVVAGCFAILWPSLFYPMLKGSFAPQTHTGCCNVLSSTDVNIVKIVMDICDRVIDTTDRKTKLEKCRHDIFNTCAINITDLINENKVGKISHNKHLIDEIRSLNGSLCLKYHYGVSLTSLGVTHRLKESDSLMNNIPQERTPVHLRASKATMHPALMEKGRAIPQPHIGPRHSSPTPHSFKPPIPGSRPTMGGMGGTSNKIAGGDGGGAMNILMPMYTIGILLFFVYTMMKLLSKKDDVEDTIDDKYSSHYPYGRDSKSKLQPQNLPTKLGFIEKDTIVNAFSSLLEDVNREILSSIVEKENVPTIIENEEFKNENIDEGESPTNTLSNDNVNDTITTKKSTPSEESKSIKSLNTSELYDENTTDSEISVKKIIQVVNMETSESVGGGHCWTPTEKEKIPSKCKTASIEEPISLLIPGMIPKNSQVLISDGPLNTPSETEDHEAVISSKVTLSLIPDDRVEEYLTGDEAEDDNTTSTLPNIN